MSWIWKSLGFTENKPSNRKTVKKLKDKNSSCKKNHTCFVGCHRRLCKVKFWILVQSDLVQESPGEKKAMEHWIALLLDPSPYPAQILI
jgi:hypothetical protein